MGNLTVRAGRTAPIGHDHFHGHSERNMYHHLSSFAEVSENFLFPRKMFQ